MFVINQNITQGVLEHLLSKISEEIQKVQLIKKMPSFLHQSMTSELKQQFQAFVPYHEQRNQKGLSEEKLSQIPFLMKDNLMPKQMPRQSEQVDTVDLDKQFSIKGSKKNMLNTKNSLKRKSLQISSMNATGKSSLYPSKKKRKEQEQTFISLNLQEQQEDDRETKSVKWKKQLQIRQDEKQLLEEKKRREILKEKRQAFEEKYKNQSYTFNFDGDAINSAVVEEPLNYHSIKLRLTNVDKKLKSSLKKQQPLEPQQIIVKKKWNKKSEETQKFQASLNIPVFDIQDKSRSILGIPSQLRDYRLKEYRKRYGGKFNRLEKSLNTIDVNRDENLKEQDELFSSRRYLKDQASSLNKSLMSERSKEPHRRKLALPRLKGKYSTLDRYEED